MRLTHLLVDLGLDLIDCSIGGTTGPSLDTGAPPSYAYQALYVAEVRRQITARTMAVGLIVHAHQAEEILATGQAVLVALRREMLMNPKWAIDAAQKLGVEPDLSLNAPRLAYWLARRARTVDGFVSSTVILLDGWPWEQRSVSQVGATAMVDRV